MFYQQNMKLFDNFNARAEGEPTTKDWWKAVGSFTYQKYIPQNYFIFKFQNVVGYE